MPNETLSPDYIKSSCCNNLKPVRETLNIEFYDGSKYYICKEHFTNSFTGCFGCGGIIYLNSNNYSISEKSLKTVFKRDPLLNEDLKICKPCHDRHFFKCYSCGGYNPNESMVKHFQFGKICQSCARSIRSCAECNKSTMDGQKIDDSYYCRSCFKKHFFACDNCGTSIQRAMPSGPTQSCAII